MNDKAMKQRIDQVRRHVARGQIIHMLCAVYGDEKMSLSIGMLAEKNEPIPLEPELRYLKELGYIVEHEREPFDGRRFQATAKGYALWCGDTEDVTIALPNHD